MSFSEYMSKIKGDFKIAVKVEWLNPDDSVNFEFTNSLYDLKAQVDVKYKKGNVISSRNNFTFVSLVKVQIILQQVSDRPEKHRHYLNHR